MKKIEDFEMYKSKLKANISTMYWLVPAHERGTEGENLGRMLELIAIIKHAISKLNQHFLLRL